MAGEKIVIRRMKASDAEAIEKIDAAIEKKATVLDFKRIVPGEVKRKEDASYVAEIKGKVVGFMISYVTYGNFGADRCAWIARFGVNPKMMGQGIGKRLAEETLKVYAEKGITEIFTSVRWDATDILSFFKTLGFERSNFINLYKKIG
ncbi:MAG: GNAT family N-acetyltransferase [Desulfobacterota bacterium]|nr:GNAT family N-acetyltransferase [Thermodesulfobacteriota bacterium]